MGQQVVLGEGQGGRAAVGQPQQHAVVVDREASPAAAAPGCVAAHAALIASMIAPSSTRRSVLGSVGAWPCLADRMIVVLPVEAVGARSATRSAPTWASM